ncbi:hypothetical protein CDG61_01940 [Acinetobacter sp. WCHAc010052]|nr:hypothetical protein CDG61_01940 [Acinetobacter sp. WCHAc010052]
MQINYSLMIPGNYSNFVIDTFFQNILSPTIQEKFLLKGYPKRWLYGIALYNKAFYCIKMKTLFEYTGCF